MSIAQLYNDYANDYPRFAKDCLKIRPKKGGLVPFVLNESQQFVHKKMQAQKHEHGRIRALTLKGRQSGISTMIEGMNIHKSVLSVGIRSAVLAHTGDSATALFDMTKRFHDHLPAIFKHPTKRSNAKELVFDGIDTGVRVYSAGGEEVGRGTTMNGIIHLSEAAFYENATQLLAGLLQSVPDSSDIVIESTANGMSGWFYSAWKQAEAAQAGELTAEGVPIVSEFIPIFLPFFWVREYRREPPPGFTRTAKEQILIDLHGHEGLDDAVLYWRRLKIAEFTDGECNPERVFDQEYPHCPEVAFTSTMSDGIISADSVLKAQTTELKPNTDAPIIGVDVSAGEGNDRIIITWRWGSKFYQETYRGNSYQLIDHLFELMERDNPQAIMIDGGAMGVTVAQGLHAKCGGVSGRVHTIYFGDSPEDKSLYLNARAEMVGRMSRLLLQSDIPVDLPNDVELRAELCAYRGRKNAEKQLILLSKDEMKKELGRSPDKGDSAILTLARREYF